MTTQTTSIAAPAPRRGPGRALRIGLALGAVVAIGAGVGLWRAERGGDTADPATPPTTAVARPSTAASAEPVRTIYVVGSEEQAVAMQAALAEADAIGVQSGAAPRIDQVMVVPDAEADAFFRMMAEQDALRAQLGLPGATVVDLRHQPSAAAPTPADTAGGLAELIRDGGVPASLGVPTAAARSEAENCGTVPDGPVSC